MAKLFDQGTIDLANGFEAALSRRTATVLREVEGALRAGWQGYPEPAQPARAFPAVLAAHDRIVRRAVEVLPAIPYAKYLWLLRRLDPGTWDGQLATTGPYDSQLAEALAAKKEWFDEPPSGIPIPGLAFKVTPRDCDAVAELFLWTKVISDLHTVLRLLAKGAALTFGLTSSLGFPWPIAHVDESTRRAVALYDGRVAAVRKRELFSGLGTAFLSLAPWAGGAPIVILSTPSPGAELCLPSSLCFKDGEISRAYSQVRVSARGLPHIVNADEVARFVRETGGVQSKEAGLAIGLCTLVGAILRRPGPSKNLLNLLQRGYLILSRDQAKEAAPDFIDEVRSEVLRFFPNAILPDTLSGFLEECHRIEPCVRPLRAGRPATCYADFLLIDLSAATSILVRELEYTRDSGAIANDRAAHWESAVRAIIEETRWAPTAPPVANLLGRTLFLEGKAVTDMDALALLGNHLLLVSCKSIPYRGEYDAGDYRIVRNVCGKLEAAVEDWDGKMDTLRRHPVGDNYDLSGFQLHGVVCVPHPYYVAVGRATREVLPGLLAVSSLSELEGWLRTSSPPLK